MMPRKLYVMNEGIDKYAKNIYKYWQAVTREGKECPYATAEEVKKSLMQKLKLCFKGDKIRAISILKDGRIRVYTNDLFITTNDTGRLRKWYIGKWRIDVNTSTSSTTSFIKFNSLQKEELGWYSTVWGSYTVHPHIKANGYACLGNAVAGLSQYTQQGEPMALLNMAIGYLESVNIEDSAGRQFGKCHEVELDEAGQPVVDENGAYVFQSMNEFTKTRLLQDSYAEDMLCTGDVDMEYGEYILSRSFNCAICGKRHNELHLVTRSTSPTQAQLICEECAKTMKTCDICGDICNDKHTYNDVIYCNVCAKKYIVKCAQCDDIIDNGITKDNCRDEEALKQALVIIDSNRQEVISDEYRLSKICTCTSCKDTIKTNTYWKDKFVDTSPIAIAMEKNTRRNLIPRNTVRQVCAGCGSIVPVEYIMNTRAEIEDGTSTTYTNEGSRCCVKCLNFNNYSKKSLLSARYNEIKCRYTTSAFDMANLMFLHGKYTKVDDDITSVKYEPLDFDMFEDKVIGNEVYKQDIFIVPKHLIDTKALIDDMVEGSEE